MDAASGSDSPRMNLDVPKNEVFFMRMDMTEDRLTLVYFVAILSMVARFR